MNRIFILFISFFHFFPAFAQEKLGIANSNYSSINSIFLNPSSSVDSRTLLQANLVGLNVYLMNNQVYMPSFNVWAAKNGDVQDPKVSTMPLKKFVYAKVEVNGPSLVVSNREIGIGFFVRGRAEVDIRNIPEELTEMLQQQETFQPELDTSSLQPINVNLRNAKMSEMAWVEYGLNFGKMYFKHGNVLITAGGNAKYLTGINIGYANLASLYARIDSTQIEIKSLRGKLRYNEPGWNTGRGIGIDLGITYKKMLNFVDTYYSNSQKSSCKYIDYRYKVGVSLLDLGAIRFTKATTKDDISGSSKIDNFEKLANIDSVFRADFKITEQINSPILACLPTALSVQADWNMTYFLHLKKNCHFYINTTAIQALTTARVVGVQRSNLISVAPRFEFRNVELAIPLTFQRYIYPQLGFAFRFRTFVLGMDNILPLIVKNNTYGANIYFNFGISMFKNPACKVSRPRFNKPKNYEGYTFLSLKNKSKRTVAGDGKGEAPEGAPFSRGGKSSKKKEKKRGIISKPKKGRKL